MFSPKDFRKLNGMAEDKIDKLFLPRCINLIDWLNTLSCFNSIHKDRNITHFQKYHQYAFPSEKTPIFKNLLKYTKSHWYFYNIGGRFEAQFNIGMYPDFLRIGIGFEHTLKGGGTNDDLERVEHHFIRFVESIDHDFDNFSNIIKEENLQIEIEGRERIFSSPEELIDYLNELIVKGLKDKFYFIGSLLHPYNIDDLHIYTNEDKIKEKIKTIFERLYPYWKKSF